MEKKVEDRKVEEIVNPDEIVAENVKGKEEQDVQDKQKLIDDEKKAEMER